MAKKTIWQRIKGWFTGEDKKKKKATPPATRVTMNEMRAQSNSPRRAYIDTIRGKDVKDEMRSLNSAYKAKKFDYADMTESIDNNLKVTPPTSKTASKLPAVDKRLANTVRKSEAKDNKNISAPSTGQRSKQWKVKTEAEDAGKRLTEYYKSQGDKVSAYQNVKTKKYTPPEPTSKPIAVSPQEAKRLASLEFKEWWDKVKTMPMDELFGYGTSNISDNEIYKAFGGESADEKVKSGLWERTSAPYDPFLSGYDDLTQRTKQGYDELFSNELVRRLYSLGHGFFSKGYTLDTAEAAQKYLTPYMAEHYDKYGVMANNALKYQSYEENKNQGWETAGEILGTLASFGGSFGAYEKAVTKMGGKMLPKTAEKLAEKKLFKALGKKGAEKAFGKTLAEVTTKEFAEKVIEDNARKIALKKAEQVLGVTVADLLQDATMGTIYDVTKASEYYEPFTNEWWKEVKKNKKSSVFFNSLFALGRIGKGVTPRELAAISRAELAAKKGAEKAVAENADEIVENLRPQTIEDTLVNDTPELVRNADEAVDGVRSQTIEDTLINEPPTPTKAIEDTLINEPPASAVDDVVSTAAKDSDEVADSLVRNADDVADSAKKEVPPTVVGKGKKTYTEATLGQRVKKVNKKIKNAVDNEQAERIANGVEIEGKWHDYNSQIRKASNGNVGMRKGAKTLGKNAVPIEQKRILSQMTRESNDYLNGFIENADASETLYSTWNAVRKEQNMAKSYAKATEDVNKIIDNIQNKLNRFIKDPDNGTDIKISDVTDMVAVKQVFHEAGMEVPPEVRGMFDRIILAQKTEHAQGLAVTEQILREFDPEIKGAYIKKDFDKFLSRFGNSSWDDVAEALDRKHNANGYLKEKLEELIKFNGSKEEFRAMYKKLQTEILRNSKPSVWNLIDSLRHTFMLSNFATAMRNLFGNTSQRLMYDVADKINLGFESALARKLKTDPEFAARFGTTELERTTSIVKHNTDNYRLMHEFTNGKLGETLSKKSKYTAKDDKYVEYLRKIINEDVENISGVQKLTPHLEYGMDYEPANLREAIVSETYKKANLGTRVVSFMLNEPDSWFVERNYRSALMKYLEANGITDMASLRGKEELFQRARAFASDIALENTYKKASRLATLIERSRAAGKRKGSNILQKAATVALDAEVPYTKVPINMFKNSAVYSPIGLVDGGTKAIKAIHSGDIVGLQRASLELSKSLTGIGLMALGFYLNCDEQEQMDEESWGVISSAAEYLKQYGVRDNSIKVGNYNFKIADIGLGATQLLMGAAYADAVNDLGGAPPSLLDTPELVLEAFGSTFDVIGDVTLMENATGLIDAFAATNGNYDETKLSDRVKNAGAQILPTYANQFVPQPLRAFAKGTTEADLDTGVKKGDGTTPLGRNLKRGMNNYVQGIPYINENGILGYEGLPHKVDRHGNAVSTGLFPEGRDTVGKKILQSLDNFADPFSTRKINIPEADKVELNMRDEDGNPFLPREFDANRTYTAKIGKGDGAEVVDLTPKQREDAARSVKTSGKDMARALVYSKHAFFGDSHGDRAQQILRECPEDEEAAREYLYSLPEFQKLSNEDQIQYANALYYGGSGSGGERNYGGRARTSNRYVAVDINGYTDAEFRFANDLTESEQAKYNDNNLGSKGISKEDYVNAIEAIHYAEHEYKNGENIDTINGKKNIVAGILSLGLSQEENIAIYNAVKHKNWGDWDGVTDVSSGSGKGNRRYGGYHRSGGGGNRKRKVSALKKSNYRASSNTYKDIASTLKTRSSSIGASSLQNVKVEPPKVKFKKYEV